MSMNIRRMASIGCVSLSFLGVAGCSVETDGEDPGEASVQEPICSANQLLICAIACSPSLNPAPGCMAACLSRCGGPPPPRQYPWLVGCEGGVGNGPVYQTYVNVTAPLEPGEHLTSELA